MQVLLGLLRVYVMIKTYYMNPARYSAWIKSNNAGAEQFYPDTIKTASSKIQTVGESNPLWREQVAKQEDACTPRTVTYKFHVYKEPSFGFRTLKYGGGVLSARGALMIAPVTTEHAVDWTSARAQGRAKALAKVHQAHHSAMGGVLAGEILQTLHMLRHPLEALRSGFHNYFAAVEYNVRDAKSKYPKKVRIRGVNQRSKKDTVKSIIADTYLEYKFGWRPLFEDVKDTITALDRLITQHEVTRADSKFVLRENAPSTVQTREISSMLLREEFRQESKFTLSTKAALKPVVAHDFHTQFGLDLESFAPTLWELLPWSFVIDYFVNVQQLLNSTFTVKHEVIYVSQTEIRETANTKIISWDGKSVSPSSGFTIAEVLNNTAGKFVERNKVIQRVCTFAYPPLDFHVPKRSQLINLAALLASHNKATYSMRGS